MAGHYGYFGWYEPTKPREVKGGIKARSKHGSFASRWWGQRWIQTLESFHIGARLSRGRSYARKGQVANLDIGKGEVSAEVQGSRPSPYRVSIKLKTYTEKQWKKVIDQLTEQPIFAARLLGNEMPEQIETVFEKASLPLFPKKQMDLETDCSCPDWSNPCKHIAAVFYLMAESFDNDPFLLFKLRGMERNDFLSSLQDSGATGEIFEVQSEVEPEALPLGHGEFWHENIILEKRPMINTPALHAALPKRLGHPPFWRSDKDFTNEMETTYERASKQAEDWFNKISGF